MADRVVLMRIGSIAFAVISLLILMNRLVYNSYYDGQGKAQCQSNLKQMASAAYMYAEDWNGYLPPADKWCDSLNKYTSNDTQIYTCVNTETQKFLGIWLRHKIGRHEWGYAYNSCVAGKQSESISVPSEQVVIFDSIAGQRNRANAITSLPVTGRHHGGSNVAFADGHVTWCKDGTLPKNEIVKR